MPLKESTNTTANQFRNLLNNSKTTEPAYHDESMLTVSMIGENSNQSKKQRHNFDVTKRSKTSMDNHKRNDSVDMNKYCQADKENPCVVVNTHQEHVV